VDLAAIQARNLNASLPRTLRHFVDPDERTLVIIPGYPSSIAATNRRVLVSPRRSETIPTVYPYAALTGIDGSFKVLGRKFVAFSGPGLNDHPGIAELGLTPNATLVQVWRLGQARNAVAEINALIAAMQPKATIRVVGDLGAHEDGPALTGVGGWAAMAVGNDVAEGPGVEYLSSHVSYSVWNWLAALGIFPILALVVILGGHVPPGLPSLIVLAILFAAPTIWVVGTLAGPERVPILFQRAGTCTFSSGGIDFRSGVRRRPPPPIHVDAALIRKVEIRNRHLSILGPNDQILAQVPADLQRLRQAGIRDDWSFAQAMVVFRPASFVLTDPVRHKQQIGARPKAPTEPSSVMLPVKLTRDDQIWWPIFAVIMFVGALVRALLR
jgi:hypothetical protein